MKFPLDFMILAVCVAAFTLSACGSGDGDNSSSDTDNGDSKYSIGGMVSGLEGSGMVLQNNATNDLQIDRNGDFTFETTLQNGATYDVTVAGQPSNPAQDCTVENGSGTLGESDITNVSITCTTSSEGGSDTAPEAFDFPDVTDAEPGSVIVSDSVMVRGIDAPAPISVVGGEYAIDDDAERAHGMLSA